MNTWKSIRIVLFVLVSSCLCLSSQSFAVSSDVKIAIKEHYKGKANLGEAKKIFKEVVADSKRNQEDRKYALIFLAIISLEFDEDTKQADKYLCQILNLEPEFDPELSVCDIKPKFKTRFNQVKKQKGCLISSSSGETCGEMVSVWIDEMISDKTDGCKVLLDKNTILDEGQKNAFTCYTEAKELCSYHAGVQQGFKEMEQKYIHWTDKKITQKNKERANEFLDKLRKVNPESPAIEGLRQRISQM